METQLVPFQDPLSLRMAKALQQGFSPLSVQKGQVKNRERREGSSVVSVNRSLAPAALSFVGEKAQTVLQPCLSILEQKLWNWALGIGLSGKDLGHCSFAQSFALIQFWLKDQLKSQGGGRCEELPANLSLMLIMLTPFQKTGFHHTPEGSAPFI